MSKNTDEDRDTLMEEIQYVYPTKLLYEFSKKAVNYYENGKQAELLCYIVGYKKENMLIATEIVFPLQKSDNSLSYSWEKKDRGK